ncbi:uncharacterized protein KRP23_6768 [Phytophthora ramorum]|uniref:uncharacterized protein n=1 Tax=Phytophthora ramorum TaxID=164328 RepID=UPI0030A68D87|nr:hypothetical protein KRP23_6768 [Phytophthora ramorum]
MLVQDAESYIAKRQCIRDQLSPADQEVTQEPKHQDEKGRGLPKTLALEYWARTDECLERKWAHMDMVDRLFDSREGLILATTLGSKETALEPNMFPYDTPEGVEHWTLWSRHEMDDAEIQEYVRGWLCENAPRMESWNYDENLSRSIDIFHVHVYFQLPAQQSSTSKG